VFKDDHPNLLFKRTNIFDVVQKLKEELKGAFQTVSDAELEGDPVALAGRLIEQFSLNVPLLDESKKYALTNETQIDVSKDPSRRISNRSRPFYIAGTEIRVVVPFEGDAWLFRVRPTMHTLAPPFAEIQEKELHLLYRVTDASFDVESDANRTIGRINQNLQSLRDSAEQLKTELQQQVAALIDQRKRERSTHAQIVANLKIPVKQRPAALREQRSNRCARANADAGIEYFQRDPTKTYSSRTDNEGSRSAALRRISSSLGKGESERYFWYADASCFRAFARRSPAS
jgi:hypothetical protein